MVRLGSESHREVRDYMLTRYACYKKLAPKAHWLAGGMKVPVSCNGIERIGQIPQDWHVNCFAFLLRCNETQRVKTKEWPPIYSAQRLGGEVHWLFSSDPREGIPIRRAHPLRSAELAALKCRAAVNVNDAREAFGKYRLVRASSCWGSTAVCVDEKKFTSEKTGANSDVNDVAIPTQTE